MRDELLAYLLNDADPEQRARIEHHLAHDPTWQHEYERLQDCLKAYETDPESAPCPPEDLVNRTCKFVERAVQEAKCLPTGTVLPASLSESQDGCAGKRRWSLADFAVGGGIALALSLLLFPALVESRDATRRAQCQDNLREIGTALVKYANIHRRGLPHVGYHENAGMFVVELADSGVISRDELKTLLVCPNTELARGVNAGKVLMRVPTREELAAVPPQALKALQKHMGGSFAYQFGYVDDNGEYQRIPFVNRGDAPMLADAPNFSVDGFQSGNHGDCGQNVIYQDLSSRYLSKCQADLRGDHLFLNKQRRHAAGRGLGDVVLGRSEATPAGLLTPLAE